MKHIKTYINEQLHTLYPPEEIRCFVRIILEKVCGLSFNQQVLCHDKKLPEEEKKQIYAIVDRLLKMEPLQYILGETEFYSLPMKVNPSVLIPRPETEELVDLILKSPFVKKQSKRKGFIVLDIGTGSGCIAIALAKNLPESLVVALDNSVESLQVAKQNAQLNEVQILFSHNDILNKEKVLTKIMGMYSLIVSNPPYIRNSEKASMNASVLNYEPHKALFVPDSNPLKYYNKIADLALKKLIFNGMLFLEINPLCSKLVYKMLNDKGFYNVRIIHDLSGKERFIAAHRRSLAFT